MCPTVPTGSLVQTSRLAHDVPAATEGSIEEGERARVHEPGIPRTLSSGDYQYSC